MNRLSSKFYQGALGGTVALALLVSGINTKNNDVMAQTAKQEVKTVASVPSLAEVKAIAEEGFIYGLPIVMNYGVM
jgi:hypothetical protein